ncbi:MAG: hypothetical protein FP814_12300 [Desulfobacterium sp.]|nr:hypothetical protein [Desulfobacterium sp.]
MDQTRQVLRYHHYAYRTEQTFCDWIMRYIKFHGGKTHPTQMGKTEIDAFLSHLATHDKVSAIITASGKSKASSWRRSCKRIRRCLSAGSAGKKISLRFKGIQVAICFPV